MEQWKKIKLRLGTEEKCSLPRHSGCESSRMHIAVGSAASVHEEVLVYMINKHVTWLVNEMTFLVVFGMHHHKKIIEHA